MTPRVVLVIEDDPAIRRGLADALGFGGYRVVERGDGASGLEAARHGAVDLVLLDVLLPELDGFAVLRELRRSRPTVPVIMITAKGAEDDRVRGLRGGADDYVVKPFSARELLARVEAVLRRSAERPDEVGALELAGRRVDLARREVRLPSGETRSLSDREAAILRFLAGNRRRAVSREELLRCVWGLDPRGLHTRAVDMHVARLREKLDDDPEQARVIVTVRNKGYMLGGEDGP